VSTYELQLIFEIGLWRVGYFSHYIIRTSIIFFSDFISKSC